MDVVVLKDQFNNQRAISKLSVLIFSHMYPNANCSTTGIFVHEQVKALREHGVDARVIISEGLSFRNKENNHTSIGFLSLFKKWSFLSHFKIKEWEYLEDVPIIKIPYLSICRWPALNQMMSLWFLKKNFKELHKKFKFQIIHAHTSLIDGNLACSLSKKYKIPYVLTEHTGPFSILTQSLSLKKQTERPFKSANKLIMISPFMLREISKELSCIPHERVSFIPNLVDIKQFDIIEGINRSENLICILWVGHFVPIKRVKELVLAFKMLNDTYQGTKKLCLNLVGAGESEQEIRELVLHLRLQEQVQLLGKANRTELNQYYNRADFLVISSAKETFGVVAIEAMSCGLPVLSTRCGGPEFTIKNEKYGLLVGHSPEELCQGMHDMITKLPSFDKFQLRQYVEKKFSKEIVSQQLIKEYKKIINL